MTKEYSPFTPGQPVPLDFFVGRIDEIKKIRASVSKSIALKNIERIFVVGDRGIGKSSICNYALNLAEKDLDVLGIHVYLGGAESLEEMVRRVFNGLLRDSINKPWYENVKSFLGNHIKQVDLFGLSVEFNATDKQLQRAVNDFLPALRNLINKLGKSKSGILLILDDINGLVNSERFANWFKSFVDESATTKDPIPITVVLVGLPEKRDKLIKIQPSLDRVFDIITIEKFDIDETKAFFRKAFNKAKIKIDKAALGYLAHMSGGYPVMMHELGDAVYNFDKDNHIDVDDTAAGVRVGASIIGKKYIEPTVLSVIHSKNYINILDKISAHPLGFEFARSDALKNLKPNEARVFDSFLRRMEKLGVLRKDKDKGRGHYSFTSLLYYIYFFLQSKQ